MNPTRRKSPQSPTCESLEGRQLLAAGAGLGMGMGMGPGMPGMGGVADVSLTGLGNSPSVHWGGQGGWMRGSVNVAQASAAIPAASQPGDLGFQSMGSLGNHGYQGAKMGLGDKSGFGVQGGHGAQGDFGGSGDFAAQGSMFPDAVGSSGTASTGVSSQLKADVEKLRTDQQAIHDKSNVTPAMEAKVRDDIKAIKGAETTTPDATATATLQKDIATARANVGGPTDAQLTQIQADQVAIYKSQGVSDGLTGQLTTDLQAIQTASGITDADRATIAADQKAIQADRPAVAPPAQAAAVTTSTMTPPAPPADATTTTTAAASTTTAATTATPATPATTTTGTSATPVASTTTATATPIAPPAVPATPPVVPTVASARPGRPVMPEHFAHQRVVTERIGHRRRG